MNKKTLGFFQLVMINVIAVDSIRTLPFSATYGFSLVFFYILAALLFFIPSMLVSAELGTGWPTTGGIYVWVREALGKKLSLLTIWLNWVYNLFWYPTIMALIAGTLTYFFNPEMADNKLFMAATVVVLFWIITLLNCFGMKTSSFLSTLGALVGTILPMVLITVLGVLWITKKNPVQIGFSVKDFFPNKIDVTNLAFLTNVFFGLLGLEMSATHAEDVQNPQKNYPKALWTSVIIILSTIVFSSLAISIVVPNKDLSLVVGTMQAFQSFSEAFNIPGFIPFIGACIILGGLSGAGAWIIGPTKGLMVASRDGSLPKIFSKTNRYGVPVNILVFQAILVTVLCLAFILMPTINSSFWFLSAMTAQLALIVYVLLFFSAIVLHHKKPHVTRSFKIPGGKVGIWLTSGAGIISSLFVIGCGFIPPSQVPIQNILSYECFLIGGIVVFCLLPFLFYKRMA
ncbi:MAG TPA: APC family permease [Chlamydiales bacterium]|nr:APC family permease [Chlamydiales bacterium]